MTIDLIERDKIGGIGDRGFGLFSSSNPLYCHSLHQPLNCAAGNRDIVSQHLSPDFASAVNPHIILIDIFDFLAPDNVGFGAQAKLVFILSFGNMFREACRLTGVEKSAHGVRKISATRAAEAGATVAQLKVLFGWTDDEMPSLYTKSADRRKLAREAIHKLEKVNKK